MEEDYSSMIRPFISVIEKAVKKSVREILLEQKDIIITEAACRAQTLGNKSERSDEESELYLGFATANQIVKRCDPRLFEGPNAPFRNKYDIFRFCKANPTVFMGKARSKNQAAAAIDIHNALVRQNERDIAEGKKIKFNIKRK